MPKTSSRLFGRSGESATPDSYHVEYIKITTNSGDVLDIKDLLQQFEITESVNSPTITALFVLADAANFFETYRLNGNEKIDLLVQRAPLTEDSQTKVRFKLELYIAEIFGYVRNEAGKQFYQFRCVSKHMYHNQLRVVHRAFQGSIGQLVENICKHELKLELNTINKSTKKIIKGVYPSIRPIHTINWLMRNAFDNSTQFYFYETARDGVIFDSYKSIVGKEVHSKYNNAPFYKHQQGSPEAYEEEREKILHFSSPLGLSKLAAAATGCFASTSHTLDISTKTYKKDIFDYENGKFSTLNAYKPYDHDVKFFDQPFNKHKEAKNYFVSLNKNSYGNFDNYHAPLDSTIGKSEATLHNLEFMTHQLLINGDFDLSVGMNIDMQVLKASESEYLGNPTSMIDKVLSGVHMVTELTHVFEEKYRQRLTVKKDSIGVDLNAK